jgi:hypothetical protein
VYQIFEIMLRSKELDVEKNLDKVSVLDWYSNGRDPIQVDDGLQYILDLSCLKVKRVISELFRLEEANGCLRIIRPERKQLRQR